MSLPSFICLMSPQITLHPLYSIAVKNQVVLREANRLIKAGICKSQTKITPIGVKSLYISHYLCDIPHWVSTSSYEKLYLLLITMFLMLKHVLLSLCIYPIHQCITYTHTI